ncbi:MAG: serine hydroxymethyltransferase, partial [Elusimicrobia bacterium]|nr:serine hydroxymethyltransferase [Elusimicrobiota bacterium]
DLDRMVLPGIQGGPLMHVIAAKAVALGEALKPAFTVYQKQIVANAQALADALAGQGFRLVSGGTDNHLMLVDLRDTKITGKEAEKVLDKAGITVNKNVIPFDPEKPFVTSGIRIGTPAVTTRGMQEPQMKQIAGWISRALENRQNESVLETIKQEVKKLCEQFPIYQHLSA